jgi:hypothetical protein
MHCGYILSELASIGKRAAAENACFRLMLLINGLAENYKNGKIESVMHA